MPNIRIHNGLDIEYDTFGSPHDPALLLVQGYGGHMVNWRPGFCQRLADGDAQGGLYVIRYDNRDVGLSSKFHGRAVDLDAIRARMEAGDLAGARALAPYSLSDMASDGLGLLTALGIDRAHVMGSSLGGTIAEELVYREISNGATSDLEKASRIARSISSSSVPQCCIGSL